MPDIKQSFLAPPQQNAEELIKYLLVELQVKRENHERFQDKMRELADVMFYRYKWELVFAAYPMTGQLNRFVHIWRITTESSLLDVMREGALGNEPEAQNRAAPAAGQKNSDEVLREAFRTCYQKIQGMIEHTDHRLMTSLPYDPAHVGYQTQTILIDTDGDRFLIPHSELRRNYDRRDGVDITAKLDKIRRARPKKLHSDREPICLRRKEDVKDELAPLELHLNRGTTVARLKLGDTNALLFNLASIKAHSVFQTFERPQHPEAKKPKLPADDVDSPANEIVIAAPWGSVYRLNSDQLEQIAQRLPKDDTTLDDALNPLIEANAPLAAIPEERDDVIGDGCACYIINLKSFVTKGPAQKKSAK
jgi:hypothetical protein